MTTRRWQGDAVPIAQVVKLTPPAASGEVGIAINGKVLTYDSWDAEAIADKWNLSTTILDDVAQSPEFREVIASTEGSLLVLTAATPGVPFTVTTTVGGNPLSNERQVLTRVHTASGGTFKITFDGQQTGTIAWNASAATVETALEALSNLAPADVSVSGSAGGPWTVDFAGAYAGLDVPLMTIDATSLTGGDTGANEIQRLSLSGTTSPSTFKLRRTDTLAETASMTTPVSAATVDTQVTALGYSVTCTGGDLAQGGSVISGSLTNDGMFYSDLSYYNEGADFFNVGHYTSGATVNGLIRFTLAVAQGATISQSLLTLRNYNPGASIGNATGTIYANASDNATWPANASAAGSASLTSAGVSFTFDNADSTFVVDIASVIQEIVNRAGWTSGSGIVLQLRANAAHDGIVAINSHERGTTESTLEVTTSAGGSVPISIEFDGGNAKTNIGQLEVIAVSGTPPTIVTVRNGYADIPPNVEVTTPINGGASIPVTTSQSSKGPNHWDDPLNWSGGAVPVDGDAVSIDHSDISILYGLDQSSVALTSLTIGAAFTGKIGLPEVNATNSAKYVEYRQQYLKIEVPIVRIGDGSGTGSNLIRLDIQGNTTVDVRQSGSSEETGLTAIQIIGSGNIAGSIVKGSVGFGLYQGETAGLTTLKVGYRDTPTGDAVVMLGPGATCTTLDMAGGTVAAAHAPGTITMTDGDLTIDDGSITSLTQQSGTIRYNGNDTITLAEVSGVLDFRQDVRAKTITTLKLYEGAEYHDPHGTVTWTNPAQFIQCSPADVTLDVAKNVEMSLALI